MATCQVSAVHLFAQSTKFIILIMCILMTFIPFENHVSQGEYNSSGPRCLFFGDDGARLLDSHVSSMSPHTKPFQRQVVSSGKTYFRRAISKIEPKLVRYFFVHQIHEYLPTVTFCTHINYICVMLLVLPSLF